MPLNSTIPRPVVAVDVVVLTVIEQQLRCLLTRRAAAEGSEAWALPGVLVAPEEALDAAAARALRDKAQLTGVFCEQLYTFGAVDRDPRDRVLSVAYLALLPAERLAGTGLVNASSALAVVELPPEATDAAHAQLHVTDAQGADIALAFDHAEIIATAVQRIRGKLDYAAIGYELLPERFPLRDLQRMHETILGRSLNTDSFRRRILQSGRVTATGVRETGTTYRPAELYTRNRDQKQHY
ncbi:MAG: Nudix-related transcriptional regulator NrtR [Thermoleophilia bacterium]|nr:Nudix-related transcriptional regulator NrtR [Thermoleophilia bacterium]